MNDLGNAIRQARVAKGLSLRTLEAKVGVSNAHLSQLETGKIERPSMALLFSISETLELDYAALLRLAGYTAPSHERSTPVPGVAFQGSDDLTADEAEEVLRFIELLKRRRE